MARRSNPRTPLEQVHVATLVRHVRVLRRGYLHGTRHWSAWEIPHTYLKGIPLELSEHLARHLMTSTPQPVGPGDAGVLLIRGD